MKNASFFSLSLIFLFSFSSSNANFQALLSFKTTSDRSNSLSSWSNATHPCSWLGVTCNPNTTRVIRLVLQNLNLTGPIDSLTELTHLRLLSLKHNNLFSSPSLDFSPLKNLKHLYLSYNDFSGSFPSGLIQLRRLRRVDLSFNRFSGEIPLTPLCHLPHLLTLRLESNYFTTLAQVDSFTSLVDFNVSENDLSGEIPKPLSIFPTSCFTGNEKLCGRPLLKTCLKQQDDPMPVVIVPEHGRRKFSGKSILVILLIDFSIVAVIGVGIFFCCRRMKRRSDSREVKKSDLEFKERKGYGSGRHEIEEVVFFEGSKRFEVDELLKASAEMLGKGSVGTTYKVVMDNGNVVVVKRTKERRKKKEVEGLLKEIGGLRHCNVVSLRAYYCSKDELLLVYDFVPNGSLHSLLHGNRGPGRTPLDWTTRLKFALGIAEGLEFLHNTGKPKLTHGHLTSNNVVIDREGNACLSDVALHQLFLISTPTNTEYKAPELMVGAHNARKYSQRSDVYSFGVILLEILTGKMAVGGEETGLVRWVQTIVQEEWTAEAFDIELLRHKNVEDEMVALFHVALLCLTPVPRDRPKISTVCRMIKDIKVREMGRTALLNANDLPSESSPCSSYH